MEGYLNISLMEKVKVLRHLYVWKQMTDSEKCEFKNCKDENRADRLMRDYRNKYLN